MTKHDVNQLPIASLAYLGDSVLEVMVRKMLILDKKGDIHNRSHEYVTAVSQSKAVEKLMDEFTEDELAIYKRGRNHTHSSPKSATHAQYSRATGLECVFAYLYLIGDNERLEHIFQKGFK
ncbi:MAG: Mini-ribonuclease 3 [Clostridia bacterium]|nr:Mini-ribonuclease 3 [Clostridia bacterium]